MASVSIRGEGQSLKPNIISASHYEVPPVHSMPSHIIDEDGDTEYLKEVLLLGDGQSESLLDKALTEQAIVLGILSAASSDSLTADNSLCESVTTDASRHARSGSTVSRSSLSTNITSPRSSNERALYSTLTTKEGARRSSISFTDYERFLLKTATPLPASGPHTPTSSSVRSFESAPEWQTSDSSSRKSIDRFRTNFRGFSLRKARSKRSKDSSCMACHKDLKETSTLRSLACTHIYCNACLRELVQQSVLAESRMPPRCCGIALPASLLKSILNHKEQATFMRSFQQYSTPWDELVFCPNTNCGEFIPKPTKLDPKRPFVAACGECNTKVCSICKQTAHGAMTQCPLDARAVESQGADHRKEVKRCYNCRNMVQNSPWAAFTECRCKAKFCSSCGGIWSMTTGCPNRCPKEEPQKEPTVEDEDAKHRTDTSPEIIAFRERRQQEMDRFCVYEEEVRRRMWARHAQLKVNTLDDYADRESTMIMRHKEEEQKMEVRHLESEGELLEEQMGYRRMVHATLRHMEMYCERHGYGTLSGSNTPVRTSVASEGQRPITEQDRIELERQYRTRDDIPRRQESEINVLRGKQQRQLEELEAKQEKELEDLAQQKSDELSKLQALYLEDEANLAHVFNQRRERIGRRWRLDGELIRKRLEAADSLTYGRIPDAQWPKPTERPDAFRFDA